MVDEDSEVMRGSSASQGAAARCGGGERQSLGTLAPPRSTGTAGRGRERRENQVEPATAGHAQDALAGCRVRGHIHARADSVAERGTAAHHRTGSA